MYKKNIYKKEYIDYIYRRYFKFYENSLKSKKYLFPKVFGKKSISIYIEKFKLNVHDNYYYHINNKDEIFFFVDSLISFYRDNNKNILRKKIVLHGDLHFGNIFLYNEKILFIDPETPNSEKYKLFIYNNIYFELSYLIFRLDNRYSILSLKFYRNNFFFKDYFSEKISEYIGKDVYNNILYYYKHHLYRNFKLSINPIVSINRIMRFIIIYIKLILWKKHWMKLLKK